MLHLLRISNIVLAEAVEISFGPGLNVLSGETGSGKSAVMEALALMMGQRAESTLIRQGAKVGTVEASFDVAPSSPIHSILHEAGIEYDRGEPLIIRREIHANGRRQAFVNSQMADLSLLRKLGKNLVDIVGQHASQQLLSVEAHRDTLDLFAGLADDVQVYNKVWQQQHALQRELETLVTGEAERLRRIEVCRMELEELREASLKDNEDEELFSEYSKLANAEELELKVDEVLQGLSEGEGAVLFSLNRQKNVLDQLLRIDPSLGDAGTTLNSTIVELQEVASTLRNYRSRIDYSQERLVEINERLTLINRLKRKFGKTIGEIQGYLAKTEEILAGLEGADVQIDEIKGRLVQAEEQVAGMAQLLTEARNKAARQLEKSLTKKLQELNMPKARLEVHVIAQLRCGSGDDKVEFFFAPNVGERVISIKDCASGGELSRIMLSLKTLLAGKEKTPLLVFDEIDANIGGETASIVGHQLAAIGTVHQVICITHLPQVALHAQHHFQISKRERDGRTVTRVKALELESPERQEELTRMLGGAAFASSVIETK